MQNTLLIEYPKSCIPLMYVIANNNSPLKDFHVNMFKIQWRMP